MILDRFKEKIKNQNLKTGATRAVAGLVLTACLVPSMATVAYADVPPAHILGDIEYGSSRIEEKRDEYKDIRKYFLGTDRKGNANVTIEDIKEAIILSDVLNAYYNDLAEQGRVTAYLDYTNTTADEVLGLDIDDTYDELVNNNRYFMRNNMANKPAIDAYITFSCGTVSTNLKETLGNKIAAVIKTEGYKQVVVHNVVVANGEVYVVLETDGQLQRINLVGDICTEIAYTCDNLENYYTLAMNSIGGYSTDYENSFAYNGVDRYSGESAWLSLPDDTKKEILLGGVTLCETINSQEQLEIVSSNPLYTEELTRSERQALRDLGFDNNEVRNAVKRTATLNKVLPKGLSK